MDETFELKKGHIVLTGSVQDYNLQEVWSNVSESGKRIEVHRVFYRIHSLS